MTGYEALAAQGAGMYGKRLRMEDFERITALPSETGCWTISGATRLEAGAGACVRSRGGTARGWRPSLPEAGREEGMLALNHYYYPRNDNSCCRFPVMLSEAERDLGGPPWLWPGGHVKPTLALPLTFCCSSKLDYTALSQCTDYTAGAPPPHTITARPTQPVPAGGGRMLPDYTSHRVPPLHLLPALYKYSSRNSRRGTKKCSSGRWDNRWTCSTPLTSLRLKKYFPATPDTFHSCSPSTTTAEARLYPRLLDAPTRTPSSPCWLVLLRASVLCGPDVPSLEAYYLRTFARSARQLSSGPLPSTRPITYLNLEGLG